MGVRGFGVYCSGFRMAQGLGFRGSILGLRLGFDPMTFCKVAYYSPSYDE